MTAKVLKASILDLAIRGKLVDSEGEWRTMKLSEACSSIVDCPHTTAPDQGVGYPLIRTSNVGFGKLLLDDVHRVSASVYKERVGRGIPEPGDLIFAREAPAGNIAVIAEGESVCLGQRTVLLKPKREIVDSKFLAYYVLSPSVQKILVRKSIGSMVAHVNLAEIRPFQIQLPPLAEQKRIVEKIEQLMPLVERYGQAEDKRRQLIATLPEALKKSILKSAVEGKLVPQDSNDEPAARKSAIENVPYSLPCNWVWKRISEVTEFQEGPGIGKDDFRPKGVPLIRISGMQESVVHLHGCNYLDPGMVREKWNHFRLDRGDVVISTSASLDKVAVVDDECVGAIPYTGLIRFKMTSSIDREYFRLYIQSSEYARQIDEQKKGGAIKHYGPTHLRKMTIPIPPLAEQKRIVTCVESLFRCLDAKITQKG